MDPSYVSPMELLMSLSRRMSDCDKLIDPFFGNMSVLITGNAVQLAHIRSLTCSHNNKLTQSCFSLHLFFNTLKLHYLMQCLIEHTVEQPRYFVEKSVVPICRQVQTFLTSFDFLSVVLHGRSVLFCKLHFCTSGKNWKQSLTCASTLVSFLVCSAVWLSRFVPISIIVAVWLCTAVCWIWTMSCFMLSCM